VGGGLNRAVPLSLGHSETLQKPSIVRPTNDTSEQAERAVCFVSSRPQSACSVRYLLCQPMKVRLDLGDVSQHAPNTPRCDIDRMLRRARTTGRPDRGQRLSVLLLSDVGASARLSDDQITVMEQ
jgi:hypothetical protein